MPPTFEPTYSAARNVLQNYWGYPDFRPGQRETIQAVLAGRDVLAILPTGGGKSVCYQVPAMLGKGLTIVVSPLIALMHDQVEQLLRRGVPAAYIDSTLPAREVDQRWTDAEFGRFRLLYVSPERLQTEMFLARAERLPVRLLAVDEAHCVSEWGHHFRPTYLQIPAARAALNDPPMLSVTATATPEVRRDIVEHLRLRDPEVIVRGFDRPKIIWSLFRTEHKRQHVRDVVDGVPGSGLLYASTRRGVEEWTAWLTAEGVSATAYHAGLPPEQREAAQKGWLSGDARIVVATNAFGMGIDKPDVRFVIHVDLPGSLEAYYQEAGRAGRDGRRAYAVLLFQERDEATQQALITESHPAARDVVQVYDAVCNMAQVPYGVLPEAPLSIDSEAINRLTGLSASKVRSAIDLLVRQETWQALPPRRHHGLIRFLQPANVVRQHADRLENRALSAFILDLLRTVHADAFTDWWEMDLRILQRRTGLKRPRLQNGLAFLQQRGLLDWRPPDRALRVQLSEARARKLPVDDLTVQRARRRAEARLRDMLRYARSVTCRRHFLLAYFGEESPERCGACDVCLGRHRPVVITPDDEPVMRHILSRIQQDTPRAAWFGPDRPPPQQVDGLVDWLIQEGYIQIAAPLEQQFALTEKAAELLEQWAPRTS